MTKKAITKRLNNRRTFKGYDNETKTYHRKYTDEEVLAHAQEKRRERLDNPTAAEGRFEEILRALGEPFEREYIIQNGDRFVLLDVYMPALRIAIECDGSIHLRQGKYDAGRDKWLLETHGIRTIRFTNKQVICETEAVKHQVMELLNV